MTTLRDQRFAELDAAITLEDTPKFRRTMTAAAMAAQKRNGRKGIIGRLKTMTCAQKTRHGRNAQKFRVYRVTCECGRCLKCRHCKAKRKYNRKLRTEAIKSQRTARTREYPVNPRYVAIWERTKSTQTVRR